MSSSNRSNNAPSTRPSNAVRPPPPAPCQLELTDTGVSTYVDIMSDATRLASAAAATDPAEGLRAVAALRRLLEHLESVQVGNARAAGGGGGGSAGGPRGVPPGGPQKNTKRGRGKKSLRGLPR